MTRLAEDDQPAGRAAGTDFDGADGVHRLAASGLHVSATTPNGVAGYRATVLRLALVDCVIAQLDTSAVHARWDTAAGTAQDEVWFVFGIDGAVVTRIDGTESRDERGDIRVIPSGVSVDLASGGPVRRIALRVPHTSLSATTSASVRTRGAHVIASSGLTLATTAFATSIVETLPAPDSDDAFSAERVVLALLEAILQEHAELERRAAPVGRRATSRPSTRRPAGDGDGEMDVDDEVFSRALALIDRRLPEPGLDHVVLARSLGVSTRRLQRIFSARESSVSATVRVRRLDALARRLADPLCTDDIADLVAELGFGSVDPVRRAFQARFGSTMSQYRRWHREQG